MAACASIEIIKFNSYHIMVDGLNPFTLVLHMTFHGRDPVVAFDDTFYDTFDDGVFN